MSAKVRNIRGAWWVVTHYRAKRTKKRIGTTKADRRKAQKIADEINARLALGSFPHASATESTLPCDVELRKWLATYATVLKPSTRYEADRVIEVHLAAHFGSRDLREIGESDLLAYVQAKSAAGLAPATIRNHLSILRRVASLLHRAGKLTRNPVSGIGELLRRVERASASEVREIQYWTQHEASVLLGVAGQTEPEFAPLLATLFGTGMPKGRGSRAAMVRCELRRSRDHHQALGGKVRDLHSQERPSAQGPDDDGARGGTPRSPGPPPSADSRTRLA